MAIIVEDGTGLPNAESYVSVSDATAYLTAMGDAEFASAPLDDQEAALRRATQYLDTRYTFIGAPLTDTQALQWPRSGAPVWPVRGLVAACCELAGRALGGALWVEQADAQITRETVGPITVEYANGQNDGQVRFAIVDGLLRGLVSGAGSRLTLRLERAS